MVICIIALVWSQDRDCLYIFSFSNSRQCRRIKRVVKKREPLVGVYTHSRENVVIHLSAAEQHTRTTTFEKEKNKIKSG